MTSTPPPGWYPDPAGGGSLRWWTGRDWSAPSARPPAPAPIVQPPLPAGTSTGTSWIWIQAVLPLLGVLAQLPYLLSFRNVFTAHQKTSL